MTFAILALTPKRSAPWLSPPSIDYGLNLVWIGSWFVNLWKNQPYSENNSAVSTLNSWLKNTLSTTKHATFWRHRGLARPSLNIFDVDGIHINRRGEQRLFKSYRGAILFAIKQSQILLSSYARLIYAHYAHFHYYKYSYGRSVIPYIMSTLWGYFYWIVSF